MPQNQRSTRAGSSVATAPAVSDGSVQGALPPRNLRAESQGFPQFRAAVLFRASCLRRGPDRPWGGSDSRPGSISRVQQHVSPGPPGLLRSGLNRDASAQAAPAAQPAPDLLSASTQVRGRARWCRHRRSPGGRIAHLSLSAALLHLPQGCGRRALIASVPRFQPQAAPGSLSALFSYGSLTLWIRSKWGAPRSHLARISKCGKGRLS
ncbi:hypothetical protein NDU88_006564 [Pleurodeles waltl]|uniref:Uncharacterized protein n=1 Tax=Pleurodeles waltl TaxID=8319 RepID=A0AAV7X315_PLEWA|nr:hypothetical protein NDU88_006564 [Pleurodeles waltl]